MHVLSALLFAVSANIDCLAIGLSYGIQSVKIDARSNLIIAVISTAGTLISMLAGKPLAALCSADTANRIGAVLLMLIGCWILFQNHRTQQKSLKAYDRDASSRIDQKEAVVLAFALTINNMGLGISGSITGLPIPVTCLFTFLCSLLFIAVSQVAGKSCIAYLIHKYARDTAAWMIILLGILENAVYKKACGVSGFLLQGVCKRENATLLINTIGLNPPVLNLLTIAYE